MPTATSDVGHALSEPAAACALFAVALACAGLLFVMERAVTPGELPSLRLPADEVRATVTRDRTLAARAPDSDATAIEALMREQGLAEAKVLEGLTAYEERRVALRRACAALEAKGADALAVLRARAVARLEAALALELEDDEIRAVLGSFARTLAREGVTRDAEIVAAPFVVRTLYKARGNLLCGFAPDAGFARVERLAYYGWQALHAERLPPAQRLAALDRYAEAGGDRVAEARATLLYLGGDHAGAEAAFAAAYADEGSLRLRNHALAAHHARLLDESR